MSFLERFESNLILGNEGKRDWLLEHEGEILHWMDKRGLWHEGDRMKELQFFWDNPNVGHAIMRDFMTTEREKRAYFLRWITETSRICFMVGKRGAGKTATGCSIMEAVHDLGKSVQALQVKGSLPDWLPVIENTDQIEEGNVVFFDEMQLVVPGRRSSSKENLTFQGALSVSRHKSFSLIGASQHHKLVDVNMMRYSDGYLFKQLSFQELEEYETRTMQSLMQYLKRMMPRNPNQVLFSDGDLFYLFTVPLASFWSSTVSKGYRNMTPTEAIAYIQEKWKKGLSVKRIMSELALRGRADFDEFRVKNSIKFPEQQLQGLKDAERLKVKK